MFTELTINKLTAYSAALDSRKFLQIAHDCFANNITEADRALYRDIETRMNEIVDRYNEISNSIQYNVSPIHSDDLFEYYVLNTESNTYIIVFSITTTPNKFISATALYRVIDLKDIEPVYAFLYDWEPEVLATVTDIINNKLADWKGSENNDIKNPDTIQE